MSLASKETLAEHMVKEHGISTRKACKAVNIDRKKWSYKSVRKRSDEPLIDAFNRLTEKHPSIGFWQCYFRIRKQGFTDNHKRMYRIYNSMKLNIRRRAKSGFLHASNKCFINLKLPIKFGVSILCAIVYGTVGSSER